MTKAEFKHWTKNGNLTLSEERILEVSNHIAEGEHRAYTKQEAAQAVTYWSLSEFYARQTNRGFQDKNLTVLLDRLVKLTKILARQRAKLAARRSPAKANRPKRRKAKKIV